MRALLQRVSEASVCIEGEYTARIGPGLLVLLGVYPDDGVDQLNWLAQKTLALRIFADDNNAMNRSVCEIDGEVLVVSQFTLAADTSRGRRPGFSNAAAPEIARSLYEQFVAALKQDWSKVQTGSFGADMQIALVNDGPVTLLLER